MKKRKKRGPYNTAPIDTPLLDAAIRVDSAQRARIEELAKLIDDEETRR